MKTRAYFLLLLIGMFFLSFVSEGSDFGKHFGGNHITYTLGKMTPKQFSKGYKAEKSEYRIQKNISTRKMKRRIKGNWLQRYFSRSY